MRNITVRSSAGSPQRYVPLHYGYNSMKHTDDHQVIHQFELMSQEAVIQSRQFPFRFLSAYKVIMELTKFGKLVHTDCDFVLEDVLKTCFSFKRVDLQRLFQTPLRSCGVSWRNCQRANATRSTTGTQRSARDWGSQWVCLSSTAYTALNAIFWIRQSVYRGLCCIFRSF